jgi:hypothetical protein
MRSAEKRLRFAGATVLLQYLSLELKAGREAPRLRRRYFGTARLLDIDVKIGQRLARQLYCQP